MFLNLKKLSLLLIVLALAGCKGAVPKTVEAVVGKILEPVTVESSVEPEIGEVITTDDGTEIIIKVTNNSSDELRNLSYTFDTSENIFDYKPNIDGISLAPGAGGTCTDHLNPGTSCIYKMVLTPRKQGEFTVPGSITYTNRVEPQTKTLNYHLISGEPASLVFTNDVSNYAFGTFEQTEVTERFQDFEIQNTGGLPARDLDVSVNNDDLSPAYRLVSHNCPAKLMMKAKCQIRVGYTPRNNNYTDPETIFSGQVRFDFTKDPMRNAAVLNGYMSFTSSTIEAKFKTNYAQVDFGTIVTGNKELRMIKLINMGYREGIIKQLKLIKSDSSLGATCVQGTGTFLNCSNNNYDFPFVIEDTNSCFEREVVSYLASTGSPNCVFKITYWPSVDYVAGSQSLHNFNNSTLSFVYDSKWKGNVNIVTKNNVFNILSNFLAKATLAISKIELNSIDIGAGNIASTSNNSTANLGRLAKIAAGYSSIFYPVKIYYKNIGEVDANFIKLDDGKATPTTIIDVNEVTPGVSVSRDYNIYYKGMKQDSCLAISAGSECTVSFNLSPVKQSNQTQEDALMYDDVTDAFNKFKAFKFYYTDGSLFNDDGSSVINRNYTTKLVSLLIAKGKLNITPSPTLAMGSSIVIGDKVVKSLLLKNIGTGKIAALQYNNATTSNTLEVPSENTANTPSGGATGYPAFPYKMSKFSDHGESLPVGADFDCYDLMRASSATFPFTVDAGKILDEGKACALRIEANVPKNSTSLTKSIAVATDEYKRFWAYGLSNTADIWLPQSVANPPTAPKFNYWDGDDNSSNDVNSTSYFGYKNTSEAVSVSSSWIRSAMLFISKIEPVATTTMFKPAITYPVVSATYPNNSSTTLSTVNSYLFSNSELAIGTNLSTVAQRQIQIKNMYNSFGASFNGPSVPAPTIFMGSIKTSTDFYTTVSYANFGGEAPTEASIVDAGGDAGFTLTKFQNLTGANVYNTLYSGIGTFDLIFKVNIATPGTYQHCYDVIYKSAIGTRNLKTCLFANIVSTFPNLKVEYKNHDVTWNTTTSQFDVTPDASFSSFKSPYNKLSTCDNNNSCTAPNLSDEIISFSTVSSTPASCISAKNCQFDKKAIRFTNTGTAALGDLKLDITTLPSAGYTSASSSLLYLMNPTECSNLTNNFTSIQNKFAICQSEITACNNLAAGATCTINVYYTPTVTVSANSSYMFLISYRSDDRSGILANSYSYINHYIPIKYEGLTSASPNAYQFFRKGIDGVNDAGAPATATSPQTISAPETAGNWADPTNPNASESSSYPIKLGAYAVGYLPASTVVNSYYIEDAFPKTMTIYVNLKNTTTTRISFLKANPNPLSSTWNQVYPEWDPVASAFKTYDSKWGASKAKIYATEGCFYGEVQADSAVPANNKGFNSTTELTPAKKCQLKVDFSGDFTYSGCNTSTKAKTVSMGGDIDSTCNPYVYKIPFWSYKRSTVLTFKLHLREFMETTRASYTGNISNVTSTYINASTAKISFDLPTSISALVPTLGSITKYRIFWSKDSSYLRGSDIFKKTPATTNYCFADTTDATLPKTINLTTCSNSAFNISPGKYWYIKVMAIRTLSAAHPNQAEVGTFISDPKIPLLMVATPNNANLTYVDQLKSFVDNGLIDTSATYTYANAQTKCSNVANNLTIANGASNVANPRALIDFNVWSYIRSGTVPSSTTMGYTAMGAGYLPHWLNDAAVAINSSSVKLYNGSTLTGGFPSFNVANPSGSNSSYLISYNKGCGTASCNNLNAIIGGDNDSTFANGVFYTYPTNKAGFVRCYVPIVCPSNTALKLNNAGSCFLKY